MSIGKGVLKTLEGMADLCEALSERIKTTEKLLDNLSLQKSTAGSQIVVFVTRKLADWFDREQLKVNTPEELISFLRKQLKQDRALLNKVLIRLDDWLDDDLKLVVRNIKRSDQKKISSLLQKMSMSYREWERISRD